MRVVFGIDVSKASSEVVILNNGEKVHGYTISNDAIGFNRLLGDLKTVHQSEIVFKATGVYSHRLQAFFSQTSMRNGKTIASDFNQTTHDCLYTSSH